mgnify:CR=1 FL=1
MKKSKNKKNLSEYGRELKEKQKLKELYGLRERQFKNYVKDILKKRGKVEDAGVLLMKKLSLRLDNVVLNLGFANTLPKARQLVSHNHFLVNGKKINVPSFEVKKGDIIKVAPSSIKKPVFSNIIPELKKYKPPLWLELDVEKMEGKVLSEPTPEDLIPPVEISSIFEYYSR